MCCYCFVVVVEERVVAVEVGGGSKNWHRGCSKEDPFEEAVDAAAAAAVAVAVAALGWC